MVWLRMSWLCLAAVISVISVISVSTSALAQTKESPMAQHTWYRTIKVDGLNIFYREAGREAGPKDAPTLLLLHGLPSSSRMFEPLLARLADKYHMVAPD